MSEPESDRCKGYLCSIRAHANMPATEEHECPFQAEIHEDKAFRCTCCEACERNCKDDI